MTPFSDEDLKRLKWNLENHAPNWADKDNLAGLLARLEAAEAYASYAGILALDVKADELEKAWLRSKGENDVKAAGK